MCLKFGAARTIGSTTLRSIALLVSICSLLDQPATSSGFSCIAV